MKNVYIFLAGMLCGAVLIFFIVRSQVAPVEREALIPRSPPASVTTTPPGPEAASSVTAPAATEPVRASPPASAPVGALLIPVAGVDPSQLFDTFTQSRAEGRPHEAIDIVAPRGTPVVAVADGKIEKLFLSKPGGLTVYQFDTGEKLAYYYAHLDRYASGLAQGQQVKRGELLGFVGSSGNANPAHPHLHFAIFELGPEKHWWQGRAINPYPLFMGEVTSPR